MDDPRLANPSAATASADFSAATSRLAFADGGRDRPAAEANETPPPASRSLPVGIGLKTSEYRESLRGELRPTTALESILVDEMARHAAAMEFSADAEGRVLRFAARSIGDGPGDPVSDSGLDPDALFAGAVTNHATERIERYGHQHRRGFYRAFSQLQLLREHHAESAGVSTATMFPDEQACESYLIGRLQASPPPCPQCAKSKHHFLPCRRRFECAACGAQFGLRYGTVMERSPLTLAAWFAAIQAVCAHTRVPVRELSNQTGIKRLPTVRAMQRKIRQAIESGQAERSLAGLHAFGHDCASPAAGAAIFKSNSKPETSTLSGPHKSQRKPR